ncbi:hypothetical protein T484DRAFT_1773331 [Baffinella frigidus]|nr:hypothetical protein T484DRAFT_1773331 [Cryptophyta sp. CCMP2293]
MTRGTNCSGGRLVGMFGLRALVLALALEGAAGFISFAPPAPPISARLICTARSGLGIGGGGLWREAATEAPRFGRAGRAGLCAALQMSGTGSVKSQQMMARLKALKFGGRLVIAVSRLNSAELMPD